MFALLFVSWAYAAPLDAGLPPGTADEPFLDWVLLRVEVEASSAAAGVIVAPPPGVYPFRRGDIALLRAYDRDMRSLSVHWAGDVSETGAYIELEMDAARTVQVVEADGDDDITIEDEGAPWFEVREDKAVYTFIGGGNMYGWFGARRDRDQGAGITHLTHGACPDSPLWHGLSLNLEHIFTGAAADAHRSRYTPRMDPMRFRVESSASVRVHWPAEHSAWNMDCEMVYTFAAEDALDIEFAATPRDDTFPLEYVVFMWASYHHRFIAPAIFFPGMSNGTEGWMQFGLTEEDSPTYGGVVARVGAAPLAAEKESDGMNLQAVAQVAFTRPFYLGLIESCPSASGTDAPMSWALPSVGNLPDGNGISSDGPPPMAHMLMFEQDAPVRFALWNWGSPPMTSAWDWQYVLEHPQEGQCRIFRTRMVHTPYKDGDAITDSYLRWQAALDASETEKPMTVCPGEPVAEIDENINRPWPELDRYWGPSNHSLVGSVLANAAQKALGDGNHALAERLYRDAVAIEPGEIWPQVYLAEILERRDAADEALLLYQQVLRMAPETSYAAYNLDALYTKKDNRNDRVAFWRSLYEQYPEAALPALRLGIALYEMREYAMAYAVLAPVLRRMPDNNDVRFHVGRTLLFHGETEEALGYLTQSVANDKLLADAAALALAERAQKAAAAMEYLLAERLYRLAVSWAPDNLWHKVALGELLEELDQKEESLGLYKDVLQVAPDSPYTAMKLDALYDALERRQARADFWHVLHQQYPNAFLPAMRLGLALYEINKIEAAFHAFEQAVENAPERHEALVYAGWMQALLGHVAQGLDKTALALEADPSLAETAARVYVDAAKWFVTQAKHEEAITCFQRACTLAPQDLSYRYLLAEALLSAGNTQEALAAYLHVVRHAPEAFHSARRADAILIETADAERRIQTWQRLAGEEPKNALAWLCLGNARAHAGDQAGAAEAWKHGREHIPGFEEIRRQFDNLNADTVE